MHEHLDRRICIACHRRIVHACRSACHTREIVRPRQVDLATMDLASGRPVTVPVRNTIAMPVRDLLALPRRCELDS
jgi:hypothetical protein